MKDGLVFFWAAWLSIVFLTNLFEGLKRLGLLSEGWKFASQNYELIQKTISVYSPPDWLAGVLFLGVVLWQGLALVLLWVAFGWMLAQGPALAQIDLAFGVLLGLWAAFMLADEIFRAYENQTKHLLIFISQLITVLLLHFL